MTEAVLGAHQTPRAVVLLGLESRYGHEIIDLLASAGVSLVACIRSIHDTEIAGHYPSIQPGNKFHDAGFEFVTPLLTPGRRKKCLEEARELGLALAPPIVHPRADVSTRSNIEDGALIGPLCVVGAHVNAGKMLMVNRAATVGHDCEIGEYCTIGPSATICGSCMLADGAYIGAGAVLLPNVKVGRNAVVGAGATVIRDVGDGTVVVGNPARVAHRNQAGYRNVGV